MSSEVASAAHTPEQAALDQAASATTPLVVESLHVDPNLAPADGPSDELRLAAVNVEKHAAFVGRSGLRKGYDQHTAQAKSDVSLRETLLGGGLTLGGAAMLVEKFLTADEFAFPHNQAAVIVGGACIFFKGLTDEEARRRGKIQPVELPDGYSIQCLRASKNTDVFTKHEVVAFVHPRAYEAGTQQSPQQARDRLKDALLAVDLAPSITKVVVPASVAKEAGVTLAAKPYYDTVSQVKPGAKVTIPYSEREQALVLTREQAKAALEMIVPPGKKELLRESIMALAERFSPVQAELLAAAKQAKTKPKKLLSLLTTLVGQTVHSEMQSRTRLRGHDYGWEREPEKPADSAAGAEQAAATTDTPDTSTPSPQETNDDPKNKKPRYRLKGRYFDISLPLHTHIDTLTDPHDPIVRQWSTSFAGGDEKRLSQMGGPLTEKLAFLVRAQSLQPQEQDTIQVEIDKLQASLAAGVKNRTLTTVQLLSLSLQLLKHESGKPDETTPPAAKVIETEVIAGGTPQCLGFPPEKRSLRQFLAHGKLGRAALVGMLTWTVTQGIATGYHFSEASQERLPFSLPGAMTNDSMVWRIDEHGLDASGRYAQQTFTEYDAASVQWRGAPSNSYQVATPNTSDTSRSHLTVSTITNSNTVDLPVREQTAVDNISATTYEGEAIPVTTYRHYDNTWFIRADNHGRPYKLSYDLVYAGNSADAYALRPPTVRDKNWENFHPERLPLVEGGNSRLVATNIANNFTYDATPALRDELHTERTAEEYVGTIYEKRRCDCVECATAAALIARRMNPSEPIALASGYRGSVPENGDHTYLTKDMAHAWLVGKQGTGPRDATARHQDAQSMPQRLNKSVAEMDKNMADGGWNAAGKAVRAAAADGATALEATPESPERRRAQESLHHLIEIQLVLNAGILLSMAARRRKQLGGVVGHAGRSVQWAVSNGVVHPNKAAVILAWHEHGNGGPLPPYDDTARIPYVDNISNAALQNIADGGLRHNEDLTRSERRAVRRMAKLLLKERRVEAQQAANRKKR